MAKKVARPNKKPPEAESRPPTPAEIAALATCERYGNKADELLEILHDLQHQLGHIPEETLPIIGRALNRSRAEVHGVVTFYHDFKRHPIGKHVVKICRAESCQAVGTDELCRHAEQSLNTRLGCTTVRAACFISNRSSKSKRPRAASRTAPSVRRTWRNFSRPVFLRASRTSSVTD